MGTINEIVNKGRRKLKYTLTDSIERAFYSKKAKQNNTDTIILRLDGIGDYILFRNFIEDVYRARENSGKIVLCGNILWKDLAEKLDCRFISEFIWVNVPLLHSNAYRFSIYRKLQATQCAILLHPVYSRTDESDKLAVHSGAREIVGYNGDTVNISAEKKEENNKRYSRLIEPSQKNMFEFYRNKYFFEAVLNKKLSVTKPAINLPVSNSERGGYIIIFPGAGHQNRKWPVNNFAALCKNISQTYKLPILICGSERDSEVAREIIANSDVPIQDNTGKFSLFETTEVMQKASLVISSDSGPMHISVALNIPTICISNGNNYNRFCPYPDEMGVKLLVVLPGEFENMISNKESRENLFGKESELNMNLIPPEKVFQAVKKILA